MKRVSALEGGKTQPVKKTPVLIRIK